MLLYRVYATTKMSGEMLESVVRSRKRSPLLGTVAGGSAGLRYELGEVNSFVIGDMFVPLRQPRRSDQAAAIGRAEVQLILRPGCPQPITHQNSVV